MKVYVAMINDRHTDPEPYVFTNAHAAIDYARREAKEYTNTDHPEDYEEREVNGWLFYASYSVEGDSVWVIEKELQA
jgi:hypothetical protein